MFSKETLENRRKKKKNKQSIHTTASEDSLSSRVVKSGSSWESISKCGRCEKCIFLASHLFLSLYSTLLGLSLPIFPSSSLLLPPPPLSASSPSPLLSSPPLTCASGRPAGVIEATEECCCCCCCSSMLVNCDFSVSFSWSQMIKIHSSLALTLPLAPPKYSSYLSPPSSPPLSPLSRPLLSPFLTHSSLLLN